jgi:F-BAR domain only protein
MKAVTSSQSNLASMAKELGSAQKKAEKARGGRKEGEMSSGVGDASRQWESQAPYIFEQLQAVDEKRVNHLRDVLTQLQTHEADQVERSRASAESCLNALLNLETADEIKTFTEKVASGRTAMQRRRSSVAATRPPTSSALAPPEPPPPRPTNSRRESSTSNQDRLAALPEQTPSKSKLGGLKRLGTVMSRRKSNMPPPPTPEKKKDRRSMMPFRRGDSSRSFQDLEETGRDLTPVQSEQPSHGSLQQLQSAETSSRDNITRQNDIASVPVINGANGADGISEYQPPPGPPPSHITQQATTAPTTIPEDSAPLQPSPPVQQDPLPSIAPLQPQGTGTTENEESTRAFAIRDQPIREDESEAQLAMSNMANQLRMQGASSGINRVQGSVRGRRDVRNTMFIPAGVDVLSAGASAPFANSASPPAPALSPSLPASNSVTDLASPIQQPIRQRTLQEDVPLGSDAGSVHSAHSLANLAHHPELHEPGLNASVVETINTWFSPTGVTKSFVTGEIALAYNPDQTSPTASDTETIRLQRFELLEKVAANPTFVTAAAQDGFTSAEDSAGTYKLALSSIKRPTPTVGLKYQLHIDESNLGAYSPILLTPAWQLIDSQASVILLYSLNPTFGTEPLTLKNVVISVTLDVGGADAVKPTAAQMKPQQGASFRRKAGAVTWRFGEFVVKGGEQEKLLVRFTTAPGVPKKGNVDVRFEVGGRAASGVGVLRKGVASVERKKERDPFADDGGELEGVESQGSARAEWVEVTTKRGIVTGKYTAA